MKRCPKCGGEIGIVLHEEECYTVDEDGRPAEEIRHTWDVVDTGPYYCRNGECDWEFDGMWEDIPEFVEKGEPPMLQCPRCGVGKLRQVIGVRELYDLTFTRGESMPDLTEEKVDSWYGETPEQDYFCCSNCDATWPKWEEVMVERKSNLTKEGTGNE